MAGYESEHTKFMREWLQQHPEQIQKAQEGRGLWWDTGKRDIETQKHETAAKVPAKAYYYDAN